MEKTVAELFAGVGGFRIGLNHIREIGPDGKAVEDKTFNIVWMNQWEPATKTQHAFDCYVKRFGDDNCVNEDICSVNKSAIPDHTLLVGGFPCQDYSVAHSLTKEEGIEGKKGVLWWQIKEILETKKPPFVFLENVDRLLKSPAKQRGRDFGVMLRCFADLDYYVEWRVINAADYGMPQRRRRTYIIAYKKNTKFAKRIEKNEPIDIIKTEGIIAQAFATSDLSTLKKISLIKNYNDVTNVSDDFAFKFENCGIMHDGTIYTGKYTPVFENPIPLNQIIEKDVDQHFYLSEKKISEFKYLRGHKRIARKAADGFTYYFSEGALSPYDDLSLPSRTMLTSEGSTNRSTHIIKDPQTNNLRLLTPTECERLNQFPDGWTDTGMPENRRYFMMGNALVCGIIERIGNILSQVIDNE